MARIDSAPARALGPPGQAGQPDQSDPADQSDLPPARGRVAALDGLRVLAAFAVLVTHVGGPTGFEFTGSPASWVVSRGDVGVPIFFALSGLLLYRPWARAVLLAGAGPSVRTYFWRRALRILPAYWLVVIIALLTLSPSHTRAASAWVQYLLLLQNYNLHPWWDGTGANGLAQTWSLVVEVSFYLILPLLAAVLSWLAGRGSGDQRGRRLLTAVAVAGLSSYGVMVLAFYPSLQLWFGDTLPRLMTWFAAGMALAVLTEWARAEPDGSGPAARVCRTLARSAGACWLIAAAAFAISCTPVAGPAGLSIPTLWEMEIKTALYTVIAIALVAPAACQPDRPTLVNRVLGNRVMAYLGQISYGVFLWQYLVIDAYFAWFHARSVFQGGRYGWPAVLGILVVVTIATTGIAALSYHLVERPAQRLSLMRRRQAR